MDNYLPPQECFPSLTYFAIEYTIPDLGRTALIAEYMIDLHYFLVRVQVGIGYFNLVEILAFHTVQDSLGELLPILTFPPQSIFADFKSLISLVLLLLRANHIPNISEAVSNLIISSVTRVPVGVIATKSRSIRVSSATHFPFLQN